MSSAQMEALDFRYLLLEYYKKLNINEKELAVILMIDHLLEQKNTLLTPDLLAIKMSLSTDELDKILVSLMDRGFLVFDFGKSMKVSLKPLNKKLCDYFKKDIARENDLNSSEKKMNSLKNIISEFEESLKRQLSPIEKSLIEEWIGRGYSEDVILNALKDCLSKGKKTLKSIDKLLLQWQTREDIEKAGFSATSDKWDKNIEKTMEIAKAKWIDD